jgi:hypothetical protein
MSVRCSHKEKKSAHNNLMKIQHSWLGIWEHLPSLTIITSKYNTKSKLQFQPYQIK